MKKMGVVLLGLLVLAGCGDTEETWDERAMHLAESLCRYQRQCKGQSDYQGCYNDVVNDMRSAKDQLSDEAEEGCMTCMLVKINELENANVSSCKSEPDAQRVAAACGATSEKCAGFP
jgi:hypothetical protein